MTESDFAKIVFIEIIWKHCSNKIIKKDEIGEWYPFVKTAYYIFLLRNVPFSGGGLFNMLVYL